MRGLLIFFLSYLTLCNASIFAREAEPRMWAGPKNVIEKTVEDGKLIFTVAAVGSAKGETWAHASGYRDVKKSQAASPNNIIQIASMTKLITTIAALQLVEQGKIELDAPIDSYLPELNALQVLEGFGSGNIPDYEKAYRAPTTRELMTHTAGYVYEIWNRNAQKAVSLGVSESAFGGGGLLASPLAFQPGTAWEYGISTDLLGLLIERRSEMRLADYFEEHIFGPLGMKDSHYELPKEKLNRTVTMMARGEAGLVPSPMLQPLAREKGSMASYSGGGGLYSTVSDYGRVLQMLLNDGSVDDSAILQRDTIDAMFLNNAGAVRPATLTSVMPTLSNNADLSFGEQATFGLGLLLHPQGVPNGRSGNTGSWAGLFNSYYWVDRESGIYGIFATQVLPFYDEDSINTLLRFERAVYSEEIR